MQKSASTASWTALAIALAMTAASSATPAAAATAACKASNRPVDVTDFGATGDGKTDDSKAMQAAFDCLTSLAARQSSAALHIPAGTYIVTAPINVTISSDAASGGIAISGEGSGSSIILSRAQSEANTLTIVPKIKGRNRIGIDIQNLGLQRDGKGGTAIAVKPVVTGDREMRTLLHLEAVKIGAASSGSYYDIGLDSTGLFLPSINGVAMSNVREACFAMGASYGPGIYASSCSGAAVGVDIPFAGEGEEVEKSTFQDVGIGVRIALVQGKASGPGPTSGTIAGNTIKARKVGILISGKRSMALSRNTITAAKGSTWDGGIRLTDAGQFIVSDNTISGNASGSGITLSVGGSGGKRSGLQNLIAGNTLENLATGIAVQAGLQETHVLDNRFDGVKQPVTDDGSGTIVRN